jgi:uncharacterized protein YndB with AHSA1/START domain
MTQTMTALTSRVEHGNELVLERTFEAPRALVFAAFTRAEHLRRWWGPRGWELTHCTVDLRPGGRWHYCMKCVDREQGDFYGMESWGLGIYDEVGAPGRLVYTDHFSDEEGAIREEMPSSQTTLIFEETGEGMRVISRSVYRSEDALKTVLDMGMLQGITQTWDRLAEYLPTQSS